MTRLWNDPSAFADEMIDGFVVANERYVRRVVGGVVRSVASVQNQVAVVTGGGSGHYPAFGGLVGPGLAHGAAMGNLFASPSTQQVVSVARAAHRGAGVFFTYGNYAGDVLNFGAAQEQLSVEGIASQSVAVTDDISSAPRSERHRRRGIAGDLVVIRAAGAAAESGYDLEGVARVASLANERTRSFGVAFTGCTLPGSAEPLFTVPEGRMAVGLGIHGEPGIGETDIPTADGLAQLLVERLLDETPAGAESHVIPVLNGLGSVKYEELFVVYRRVAMLLADAGLAVGDPHVGEYCTSFDMAGVSLTLLWPDDELADLWEHPVDTPAYRRGVVTPAAPLQIASSASVSESSVGQSDEASRALASLVVAVMTRVAETIDVHVDELGRLDAIAGDGDHGIGMQRGSQAALQSARESVAAGAGAATTLERSADAWSDRAGGTSGALWGVILSRIASTLLDSGSPSAADVAAGVASATSAVMAYGKAEVGDKTLVDALVPFSAELTAQVEADVDFAASWRRASDRAAEAAAATADLLPRIGRARPHAERSLGAVDPGAHSLALIVTAVGDLLEDREFSHD